MHGGLGTEATSGDSEATQPGVHRTHLSRSLVHHPRCHVHQGGKLLQLTFCLSHVLSNHSRINTVLKAGGGGVVVVNLLPQKSNHKIFSVHVSQAAILHR